MAKQKYYVVWSGKKRGIYTSWEDCKEQVIGVKGSKYKSYPTRELAEKAFKLGKDPDDIVHHYAANLQNVNSEEKLYQKNYIVDSISVDAACSGNPGDMEYRGVYTKSGKELFHYGPIANGTNNIGEFLAIVHALALLKEQNSTLPIYSDSQIALNWVRRKHANTMIEKTSGTKEIWQLINRAHQWLHQNNYPNQLLKWQTDQWGEIKADFGRK